MIYNKEQLEDLILVKKLTYKEIGRIVGVSDVSVRKAAIRLGIELPIRKKILDNINCKNCDETFKPERPDQKFCCRKCMGEHSSKEAYEKILNGNTHDLGELYTPKSAKKFILQEQDCKCAVCNIPNQWEEKELIFVLDHIDGDSSNNLRTNLRLVCPNCDSQLPTFKSKNKGNGRYARVQRRREGKSF